MKVKKVNIAKTYRCPFRHDYDCSLEVVASDCYCCGGKYIPAKCPLRSQKVIIFYNRKVKSNESKNV